MLLFGLAGLFAKWIHLPAIGITFGRVLFSSLALGIYLLAGKQSFRLASRRDLLFLLCAGAVLAIMNKSITARYSGTVTAFYEQTTLLFSRRRGPDRGYEKP